MTQQVIQNRYILQEQLGAGAMGAVYRATDRLTGQDVALKRVTNSPFQEGTSAKLALANEFQVLASLRHPNVIHVLDYGFDDEQMPYFTMTFLPESSNISAYGAALPLTEKIHLLIDVLQALVYLERRGIIHRDIKPDNILVTPEGQVKVVDFGVALLQQNLDDDSLGGTLAYMAPEVLQGGKPTHLTDLYAVGVIAYEMFAGQMPYQAKDVTKLIQEIVHQLPDMTPVEEMATTGGILPSNDERRTILLVNYEEPLASPDIVAEPAQPLETIQAKSPLTQILLRLLAKDPRQRYQHPQRVIMDLSAALNEPVPEQPTAIRESFLQAARFVGRDKEFGQLSLALERTMIHNGSLWLIGGESGVGKSRLMNELRHLGLVRGMLVLHGQEVSEGGAPYQIWREPIKRLLLNGTVSDADASVLKPLVPEIERLLGRAVPDAPHTDSPQQRLNTAVLALFKASPDPILLQMEDLHWSPPESLEILKRLQAQAAQTPLLVIGNYRDDEVPKLPEQLPGSHKLKLERLSENAVAELSGSMIGNAGQAPRLVQMLHKETEGNIFFLIETVRALAEEAGTLEQIATMTLPMRIFTGGMQKIVQRRLEKVPQVYRPLIETAAVIGRQLKPDVLKTLKDDVDFEDWLTNTVNAAVIEYHDGRWRFAHDKLREHVLANLSAERAKTLHRQVAEAIEKLPAQEDNAAVLATHWRHAENPEKEIYYIRLAGKRATDVSAYHEALHLYERALTLAVSQPLLKIEFSNLIGGVYEFLSRYDEATPYITTALTMARQHQQPRAIAEALHKLAWIDMRLGKLDEVQTQGSEVLSLARGLEDLSLLVNALSLMGIVHIIKGEAKAAYDYLIESIPLAEKMGDAYVLAGALNTLGAAQEGLNQPDEAIRTLERASGLARQIGNRNLSGNVNGNLGRLTYNQGNYVAAKTHFEEAVRAFSEVSSLYGEALASYYLGFIALREGNLDAARQRLKRSLELSQQIGAATALLIGLIGVADLHHHQGDDPRAAELIGLIRAHPASSADADIERESTHVLSHLKLTDLDAALERGKQLNFEQTLAHEQAAL